MYFTKNEEYFYAFCFHHEVTDPNSNKRVQFKNLREIQNLFPLNKLWWESISHNHVRNKINHS